MSTHGGPETQASDNQSLSRLARVSRNKVSLEPVRIPRDGTIMPLIKGDIDAAADLSWTVLPHCFGPPLSGASSKGSLRGLSLPQVLSRVSGHHRSLNP